MMLRTLLLAFVVIATPLVMAGCAEQAAIPNTPSISRGVVADPQVPHQTRSDSPWNEGRVTRVIDGDTIDVDIDGEIFRVRYIGIDTPETQHPVRGEEPYGREAAAFNHKLVDGRRVQLEKDISETDRYGRLLRYVWLPDANMVNALLVARGYARVSTYPPDVRHAQDFLELERLARLEGIGLWRLGETSDPLPSQRSRCHASYPDFCIPPPPPDLDCAEIPFGRFTVLAPDPHRLDGNGDGIGCQKLNGARSYAD